MAYTGVIVYIEAPAQNSEISFQGMTAGEMSRDQAYKLMRDVLEGVLPSLEAMARTAKNPAGRKKLMAQVDRVKHALKAAEEASREMPTSLDSGSSQLGAGMLPGSEAA
jgi:hypothetical protein